MDGKLFIASVGSDLRINLHESEEMRCEFDSGQHIEAFVLESEQDRHVECDIRITVMSVLHLIDIVECIFVKVFLARKRDFHIAALHVTGPSSFDAQPDIEEESRGFIFRPRLQFV